MKASQDPQDLLRQIGSIQRMERGKLSIMRQGPNGPYYNFQRWQDGRNVSEYVPRDQVPVVEENLKAYEHFEQLIDQYSRLITEASRQERKSGAKKKRPPRTSPSPRKPKSKP
jgi:hypothetical protein